MVVSEGVKGPGRHLPGRPGPQGRLRPRAVGRRGPCGGDIVREGLGLKYHWAVADYLQRAARHIASKTDVEQAYAMGKAAVELALAGKNSVMPTIVRKSSSPTSWEVGAAALSDVANVEKMMPPRYITEDGFGITDACREYLPRSSRARTTRRTRTGCRTT